MSARILHLLDASTPPEAVEILALLLRQTRDDCHLAALGHHSTGALVAAAGIQKPVSFFHSMGWADPTGWRSLRRLWKALNPTHIHAWGIPAAIAVTMSRFAGERLVTLVDMPKKMHLLFLPMIHKGGITGFAAPAACQWIVTTSWLKRELHSHSIAADAVTLVRQPLPLAGSSIAGAALREDLGLLPGDGPVLLLGGDGGDTAVLANSPQDPLHQTSTTPANASGGPRHDLGLWAAAILQQIFPRIRVIVRQDSRGRPDPGLNRLFNRLPDNDIVLLAPAKYSWQDLLSIADAFVVTPDGPFAGGSILHAIAARVPVIGTPVDAVRELLNGRQNGSGVIARATHAQPIAAAIELFLANPELRRNYTLQAHQEAIVRHDPVAVVRAYQSLYERRAANGVSEGQTPQAVPSVNGVSV